MGPQPRPSMRLQTRRYLLFRCMCCHHDNIESPLTPSTAACVAFSPAAFTNSPANRCTAGAASLPSCSTMRTIAEPTTTASANASASPRLLRGADAEAHGHRQLADVAHALGRATRISSASCCRAPVTPVTRDRVEESAGVRRQSCAMRCSLVRWAPPA